MEAKPDPQHTQSDETDKDSRPTTNVNSKVDAQHVAGGKVAGVEFDGVKNSVFYIYADRAASTVDSGPAHATPAQPRAPGPNPFEDISLIDDASRFFDRENETKRIFDALNRNLCVSLVGDSKVGKSSLLSYIADQGPTHELGAFWVYVSLELHSDERSFYQHVCQMLGSSGTRDRDLRQLIEGSTNRLVLCIDEMEKLREKGFTNHIRSFLRGMADGGKARLKMVTASRQPFAQLFPDEPGKTSPLYNIFPITIQLPPFTRAICNAFLDARLAETGVAFDGPTRDELWTLTQGHPYKLQRAAHHRYEAALNPNYGWHAEYQQDVLHVK